ncbi:MAG: chemotaxis protein CheW [Alphaproteobacteria bacterium]|nr:chemotaxis protein CheW [Alphaproteobacteria bacterium]
MKTETVVQTDQYLTFTLDKEVFAIEINRIREVIDYLNVTPVPRMPAFLRGVINLRGNVVPVIDLRLMLGMKATEKKVDTCIIITEVMIDETPLHLGMLADSVQEVIDVDSSQIDAPPKLGTMLNTDFIRGMGKRSDAFFIILNIDRVLSCSDLAMLNNVKALEEKRLEAGQVA